MFMTKTEFTIIVEKDSQGGYVGSVVELPGCYSQGETEQELLENMKEAYENMRIWALKNGLDTATYN